MQAQAKNGYVKLNHLCTYVPGLSTPPYLLLIVGQPQPSFLCRPRPPSGHLSNLTPRATSYPPSTYISLNTLLAIQYSSILSTCPNHLNIMYKIIINKQINCSVCLLLQTLLSKFFFAPATNLVNAPPVGDGKFHAKKH